MITLENDVLVLERTQDGDDILPILRPARGKREAEWYIDLGIASEDVKNWLIDAEILDEDIAIRYIALNGQQADAKAHIEELISGEEGDMCRVRGKGKPPAAFTADAPKEM